jgi:aminoglycoside 3-N-acetyltransferase
LSEEKSIEMVSHPGTRESITTDLRRLGIERGMVLLVHSSMSRIGWLNGGPVPVIRALMDVLTEQGTLIMPAHSSDLSDPQHWQNPPVPESWHETVRKTMPVFDPQLTPTRQMGRIAELFRTWPGVLRSSHPQVSFAAWGQRAAFVTENHTLENSLGENSPLARMYDLEGFILLLGVGYDRNTSFHLAEYRVPNPPSFRHGIPWKEGEEKIWKEYDDVDWDDDQFAGIGQDFERTSSVTMGYVGAAKCRLMSQCAAVDFAQEWITSHKKQQ